MYVDQFYTSLFWFIAMATDPNSSGVDVCVWNSIDIVDQVLWVESSWCINGIYTISMTRGHTQENVAVCCACN